MVGLLCARMMNAARDACYCAVPNGYHSFAKAAAAAADEGWNPSLPMPGTTLDKGITFYEWIMRHTSAFWAPRLVALTCLATDKTGGIALASSGEKGEHLALTAGRNGYYLAQAAIMLCSPPSLWPTVSEVKACSADDLRWHGCGVVDACKYQDPSFILEWAQSCIVNEMTSAGRLLLCAYQQADCRSAEIRANLLWIVLWIQRACMPSAARAGRVVVDGSPLEQRQDWDGLFDVAEGVLRPLLLRPRKSNRLAIMASACTFIRP